MMLNKILFILLFICLSIIGNTQSNTQAPAQKNDTATVNMLIKQSTTFLAEDPDKAITIATQAKDIAEKIGFKLGEAYGLKNIGLGYYYKGEYVGVLNNWILSLQLFEQLNDETGIANLANNLGAIYAEQGDDEKALEYSLRSLKLSEKLNDKLRILSALNTIGSVYNNKQETKDKALDYLLRALPYCEELDNKIAFGTISENIGEIYFDKKDFKKAVFNFERAIKAFDSSSNPTNSSFAYNGIGKVYLKEGNYSQALFYHKKALAIAEKYTSKQNMVGSLEGIANVYIAQKDYNTGLGFYNKAITVGEEIKAAQELKDLYLETADAYSNLSDFKNAYKYKTLYADVKDTLYNEATSKKLGSLQLEFDLEKKQGEVNLLTKDKAITDQKLQRQRLFKNASMIGLALVMMIAILIYRNYRAKVKTHKILDQQKGEIEGLLLNILPSQVAKELQTQGHAIPRYYESVSVMFTDFKGFTLIADKMTPQNLIEELNICFIAFDEIIGKYNLEKIKTIGDSYMCAGGIPIPSDDHLFRIIDASLDIKNFIKKNNVDRIAAGLEPWYLRIGIHVGPIVAGVVGKKKYAYDIWGSTVNIASRMESNGEPGQVNVSSSVYEKVKDKYKCTYRGKIYAKNVGEIDMYFLNDDSNGTIQDSEIVSNAENIQIES